MVSLRLYKATRDSLDKWLLDKNGKIVEGGMREFVYQFVDDTVIEFSYIAKYANAGDRTTAFEGSGNLYYGDVEMFYRFMYFSKSQDQDYYGIIRTTKWSLFWEELDEPVFRVVGSVRQFEKTMIALKMAGKPYPYSFMEEDD